MQLIQRRAGLWGLVATVGFMGTAALASTPQYGAGQYGAVTLTSDLQQFAQLPTAETFGGGSIITNGSFEDGLSGRCHMGQVLTAAGEYFYTQFIFQQTKTPPQKSRLDDATTLW